MIASKFDNFDSAQEPNKNIRRVLDIKEITCKSCLNKSKLTDYVINPYTGCEHSCKYCYATFIRRFQNIKEKWGEFVYAKINCPDLLEKELEKAKPGNIFMSSVCDCYMPLESKFKITRKILEILAKPKFKDKFTIEILTKSSFVKRDFDLLNKLDCELGLSLGIIDDKIAEIIEPNASLPSERIETLKEANEQGIKVYGFISPVIPGLSDLDKTFSKLKEVGCDYVWVELLNTKPSVLESLAPIIRSKFPEALSDIDYAINNEEEYYKKKKEQILSLEKKYNLKVKEIVRHSKK